VELGLTYIKNPGIKSRKDLLERRVSKLKTEWAEIAEKVEQKRDKELPVDIIKL
jgi:hypothetical protein